MLGCIVMVTTKDTVQVYVYLRYMYLLPQAISDHKAVKTAVWEALDAGAQKNQLLLALAQYSQAACQQKSNSENMIHCCGGGIISHTSVP